MAQCKLTPREFISNAFSPQVAVVCSAIAEATCQKNNLTFIELLQPFCKLNTEGHIKDPQGNNIVIHNLHILVQDVNVCPPQPTLTRKMLNEAVSSAPCERTTVVRIGTTNLDIPVSVPWFEAWREMFLNVQFPFDHEFTKHFLACMIVVSTADDNPLEKIQHIGAQLYQNIPGKLPKWFNNNTLRYYILVHDTIEDDKNKAETVFIEMKRIYGSNNCYLLQMNSRPPGLLDDNVHLPDPWSQFLVKHSDLSEYSEQSNSPHTPTDTGGVSVMPNEVTTEPEKASQSSTPVAPHNLAFISSDLTDTISLSSELSQVTHAQLEAGQETVPMIHPLSPESEKSYNFNYATNLKNQLENSSLINANVWMDSPNRPIVQHGARLSFQDLERLRTLITEFCLKSLLPYVEKQISLLSDVILNKKGVSRSLFSATKRWFGTNKPGVPGSTPANAVIYTVESPELQLRRLGDLYFMFGHYPLAYQVYHSAKRDFAADQAWLYYAGTLEMAALSAFMQGETTRKTIEYMDDAILTYSNSCKMPQLATRATLLSAECLKGRGLCGEAAKQLIRMTSEDSDLRSALLLEQAAYCFIGPKMMRKYAFHAVLAGHRFSKAGQRKHSLRCYKQAYQVYCDRGWSLAEDHIHFTIGRLAASLKQVSDAVKAFEMLLNAGSKQPASQQAAFLREFLHTHNLSVQEKTTDKSLLPVLPLPLIDSNQIKVLFGPVAEFTESNISASHVSFDSHDTENVRWSKLEEILLIEAQGSIPMIFKPTITLYSDKSNNSVKPCAVLDEPIYFSIELFNPLRVPLPLSNVKLLWSFTTDEETISIERKANEDLNDDTNSKSNIVHTERIEAIVLLANCKQRIVLSLIPKQMGELKVLGLSYDMSNPNYSVTDQPVVNPAVSIAGKRLFNIKSLKLKNIKEKPGTKMYNKDYRLEMNIVEKAPFMQVSFSKLSPEMLCGEMQRIEVTLKNIGNAPLTNIYVSSTNSKLFSLEKHLVNSNNDNVGKNGDLVTKIRLPPSTNSVLNTGETYKMPLWVRAPHKKGNHRLDLLFYYENLIPKTTPRYRLSRHTWQLTVLDSVQISAIGRRSAISKDNSSTLNLTVRVKNMNQVHDPFMNEITLTKISLQSDGWLLSGSAVLPSDVKVQPQEIFNFLLKLHRRINSESIFSDVSLTKEENDSESITDSPYIDFIQRRHIQPLELYDNQSEMQQQYQQQTADNNLLAVTMRLNSTLILRWRAKVTEGGTVTRQAIGQHHIDLKLLNRLYKHPEELQIQREEYSGHLKIFGPDRNVPDLTMVLQNYEFPELEYQQNIVSFRLSHIRQVIHNFQKSRTCVIPVLVHMQNHSQSEIDVKVNTIGTSSQIHLPCIKSQLYMPQASTFFRYICHTAVNCHMEPYGYHTIKLQAMLTSPGTYDLASRVDVFVRVTSNGNTEFISQRIRVEEERKHSKEQEMVGGRIESVCIVNDDIL